MRATPLPGRGSLHARVPELDRPAPPPTPGLCAAVRALRAICACAEGYHRAHEPAPDAEPQPGTAAM